MSTVTPAFENHTPAMTLRNPLGWFYAFAMASVLWLLLFGSVAAIAHAMTH